MNTTIASVFLLFFLFSTKSCLFSVTNAHDEPLYDIIGDKVVPGVQYYIVSSIRGAGGGGLYPTRSGPPCPKTVAQHSLDVLRGTPVVLVPTDPSKGVINEGDHVNVTFVPPMDPICRTSTRWVVSKYSPLEQRWWINTGGFGGLKSFFQFHRTSSSSGSYNIVACYSECDSCITTCSHASLFVNEGRRLGFGKQQRVPWSLFFVKAPVDAIQQVVGKEPK